MCNSNIYDHSSLLYTKQQHIIQSILDVLSGRSAYDSGVITLDGEIVTERGE